MLRSIVQVKRATISPRSNLPTRPRLRLPMILMRRLQRKLQSVVVAKRLLLMRMMTTTQMLGTRNRQQRKLVVVRRRLLTTQSWVSKTRRQRSGLLQRVEQRRVLKRLSKTGRMKMQRKM